MSIRKKDTAISVAGIAASQLILFICFTLIGRAWGPEELGNLNLNLSIGMFLGTVVALRYELACIQEEHEKSYSALIHTIIISTLSLSTIYLLTRISNTKNAETTLIFSATFITQQASSLYLNTLRKYNLIAIIKTLSSIGFAISLALLVTLESLPNTFEIYTHINLAISLAVLIAIAIKAGKTKIGLAFFRENIKFPQYTLPATVLSSALTYSLPIIIPMLFGPLTAGYFAATQRFGFFPVSLTAQSISGIFRRELISSISSNNGSSLNIYKSHAKLLSGTALLYLAIGNLLFGPLIDILLGDGWDEATTYFRILSPLYAIQIIYIPLSQVFISTNNQRKDLTIQAMIFCTAAGSLFCSYKLALDIQATLIIFSASSTAILLLGIWTTYKAIHSVTTRAPTKS